MIPVFIEGKVIDESVLITTTAGAANNFRGAGHRRAHKDSM